MNYLRGNWVRVVNGGMVVGFLTMITILAILTPSATGFGTHQQIIPIPCLFKTALGGIPCPSCGLTTSLSYLFHGDVLNSFRTHPLGPLLGILFVFILYKSIFGVIKNYPWWNIVEKRWFQNTILCGIGLYLIIWVVRLIIAF